VAELAFELAAELGERRMVVLERLEDDRRAAFEVRRDPLGLGRARERRGRPRNVLGVVAEPDCRAFLDDAERGVAQLARSDAALDLRDRQEVVEAALLVARDEEGLSLPVLTEEA